MLRITTIVLFTALILFKPFIQFSWEIWYVVNQEFAAEELCENKEMEDLHCNGKCYLAKQLAKAETEQENNQDQDKHPVRPVQVKEQPFVLCEPIHAVYKETSLDEKFIIPANLGQEQSYHHKVFHPPQLLS